MVYAVFGLFFTLGCRIDPSYQFIVIVEPGFKGQLEAIEDPSFPLDSSRPIEIRQEGSRIRMPKGFLLGGRGHLPFNIIETRTTKGEMLSRGMSPPKGQIAARQLFSLTEPDKVTKESVHKTILVISDGLDPRPWH